MRGTPSKFQLVSANMRGCWKFGNQRKDGRRTAALDSSGQSAFAPQAMKHEAKSVRPRRADTYASPIAADSTRSLEAAPIQMHRWTAHFVGILQLTRFAGDPQSKDGNSPETGKQPLCCQLTSRFGKNASPICVADIDTICLSSRSRSFESCTQCLSSQTSPDRKSLACENLPRGRAFP